MSTNFESARNYQETLVFERVKEWAPRYPDFANDQDMLVDAACLALNILKPKYIRYSIDMMFHISNAERVKEASVVDAAVAQAFKILAARRRKMSR
jgi:hypothetical protein